MARGDKLPTIWALAPHTRAKHELLRHYLGAWFPMLSRYRGRVVVLDGFAGPGIYNQGEPGSPQIVLGTLLGHNYFDNMDDCEFVFIFNEQDEQRFQSLEQVVRNVSKERGGIPDNVKVEVTNMRFSALADEILESLEGKGIAPTFAFLDPFGYKDVALSKIAELLNSSSSCELFIYFDFNSVNRFATAGNVDDQLKALFGTEEFKQAPSAGDPERGQFLHDLYERQLKEVAGFEFVQSFEMINEQGRTGNYLFFCTRSLEGLDKMKTAMWKVAPAGNYTFDDRFVGQEDLFAGEPDTAPLRAALLERFSGKTVTIGEIIEFTISETPHISSHVKQRTLAPMQRDGLIDSPNQKRRCTFPDGTLVTFP